ncbi:hypothetical protein BDF20DRAFT_844967 [Mycotypha africana]|uniref:uncharacterized protein n=1 Tax=Mycotypha africana TaxID=64632 RepID=UPI0022FFCC25|nr:uncharacterized protein BDF20DRAFT_844967 [Mycotypha africana]KAI8991494.1 hypothetical protein BDF20DRAFT_844967 [Mycotypha africana]
MGSSRPTNHHRKAIMSKMTATTIRISSLADNATTAAALPTPPNSATSKKPNHASTICNNADTPKANNDSNKKISNNNRKRSISSSSNSTNRANTPETNQRLTPGIAGSRSMSTNNLLDKRQLRPSSAQTNHSFGSESRSSSSNSRTSNGYATRRAMMVSPAPTAPLPDFSHVKSKIGSLDNIKHKPNSSTKKIFNENLQSLKERMSAHVSSKVGSKENIKHKQGGGHVTIYDDKAAFIKSKEVKSKIGSLENVKHKPKGGDVKIYEDKSVYTKFSKETAKSKVGSLENVKHKPAGGDIKIYNDKTLTAKLKDIKPKVGSRRHSKATQRQDSSSSNISTSNVNDVDIVVSTTAAPSSGNGVVSLPALLAVENLGEEKFQLEMLPPKDSVNSDKGAVVETFPHSSALIVDGTSTKGGLL